MVYRVEISKRLLLFNSASSLATRLLSISVLIWLQQYLLKHISPEEYSLLPVIYSIMAFVPLVTMILTSGLGRYIVEAYAQNNDERITQIVSTMVTILSFAGLAYLAAGWTFAWHIDKVLNIAPERLTDARFMMALLIFSTAITLPMTPFSVGYFTRQKFVLENLINVGVELFRLTVLFSLLFGVSTRIIWIVTATASAELLKMIIAVIISRRLVPALRYRISHIHCPIARELTSFGGWNFVASIAGRIRSSADAIILNTFGTAMDVTCFHIGSMPLRQLEGVFLSARAPLNPILTTMHATRQKAALANIYVRGGRLALWAALFFAFPAIIYSREIITLYVGRTYLAAATVMALLLLIFPIAYGNTLLPQIIRATGKIKPFVIRIAIMQTTNLLLTLYLVGVLHMGALGSAISTVACFLVFQPLLMWPLGRQVAEVSLKRWLSETIYPGMFPGIVGAILWTSLRWMLNPDSWLMLGICIAAGWAGYLACILLVSIQPADREDLHRVIANVRQRFLS